MKKWTTQVLMAAILLLGMNACYYDNKEDLYTNFDQGNCSTDSVSYTNDVSVIIGNNCAISGCHVGPTAQNNLDLSQFSAVQSIAQNGQLVGRITGRTGALMPPSGSLPQCDIEKLRAWVLDGAPQN